MPAIVVISDFARAFDPCAHPRNVALVRRRHTFWPRLAAHFGWDAALTDANAPDAPQAYASARVAWIDLPMLPRARYQAVWSAARQSCSGSVLDEPRDVDEVVGLDRVQPRLTVAGVPAPRTALVPITDDVAAAVQSVADVRRLLTERMYEAMFAAGIEPHDGVYVRGFYSSVKSADPAYYYGDNQADIEATAFEVIRHLRGALEVGGLVLREYLALTRIDLPGAVGERGAIRVPYELRITVIGGRPIMASYHGPFDGLEEHQQRALLDALAIQHERVERAREITARIVAAGFPPNYVAAVAFTAAGDPVVIELNPLYAAGYNVPAAHALAIASLGAYVGRIAGYDEPSAEDVRRAASMLAGEEVESGSALAIL